MGKSEYSDLESESTVIERIIEHSRLKFTSMNISTKGEFEIKRGISKYLVATNFDSMVEILSSKSCEHYFGRLIKHTKRTDS